MTTTQSKAPNIERLLSYIKKSSWRHVSPNFTGFVKKEFEALLEKLDEDDTAYPNLTKLVREAELGRFTNTKDLCEPSVSELQDIENKLKYLEHEKRSKNTAREHPTNSYGGHIQDSRDRYSPIKLRPDAYSPVKANDRLQTSRREVYSPDKRDTYTPARRDMHTPQKAETYTSQKRDTYSPQKRDTLRDTYSPQKRDTYTPQKRDTYSPAKREIYSSDKRTYSPLKAPVDNYPTEKDRRNPKMDEYAYQRPGRHEIAERGTRSPLKDDPHFDSSEQMPVDPHKENFDSLRLQSPDKNYHQSRYNTNEQVTDSRPVKHGIANAKEQSTSASALWGREHGDSHSEKAANSTYRQSFPGHAIDTTERQDRNRYRENFSSLNERTSWARMENNGSFNDRSRPNSERFREPPSPDSRPPMELVMQFKDLYHTEWKDAYDEICSFFGEPEKTVRHLLWIVTEAYLIACDIADHQLRDLEKQAFDVMVTPGPDNEAWLISIDIANKQLKDLQQQSEKIMEMPGPLSSASREHVTQYRGRDLGDALPNSKSLLNQYRKQTAPLSLPYIREICRDKIAKTLQESLRLPKTYLNDASRLVAYIYKCAEITWKLCIQDPPIILEYITKDTEGARFNREHYVEYTKAGAMYDYGVWPLLRHGKNGRILWKGVAQAI